MYIFIIVKDTRNLSFLLPTHKYYTALKSNVMTILILIILITQQNSPKKDISYSNQKNLLATMKLERKK